MAGLNVGMGTVLQPSPPSMLAQATHIPIANGSYYTYARELLLSWLHCCVNCAQQRRHRQSLQVWLDMAVVLGRQRALADFADWA